MRIRISLPDDRDFAGSLEVLDASDTVVFGPVPAAGRAHHEPAAAHGNASRSPLRAYGDTPLGTFAVRGVIQSGPGTDLDGEVLGTHGVVLLEPLSGQAALADAHGRFRLFIQGGGDSDEGLRATAGAIRLHDQDQRELVALVRQASGRVLCEVISTAKRGAQVSLIEPPVDSDPPALPGRSSAWMRRSAKSLSRVVAPLVGAREASYAPRMFVVVPERSGSGGTAYGVGGGGAGEGAGAAAGPGVTNDIDIGPLPVTGVDVAPTPGVDLNPPPDETGVTVAQSGASDLLSTAAPTGLSNPYSATENGWIVGQQPTDPYNNGPATDNTLASFTGKDVDSFTGGPPDGNQNSYTGEPPEDAYFRAMASQMGGTFLGYEEGRPVISLSLSTPQSDVADQPAQVPADARSTDQQIQDLIRWLYDKAGSGQAPQSTDSAPPPDLNTSPAPAPDQNYTPAASPGQNYSPASPLPDVSISQTYTPAGVDPSTVSSQPNDPLPWTPAAVSAISGQPYQPGALPGSSALQASGGQSSPPNVESAGAWSRATPSQAAQAGIQQATNMGFLNPPGANVATAAASSPDAIPRQIWGQTGEISAYEARKAQGEIGILAPKGVSRPGLDYATATRLPNGDYQINVADTASRYTSNPFKTSPGAAPAAWLTELGQAFGPNGSFSLPNDPVAEQGIRNAFSSGRISNVQIDTADFSPLGQGRLTVGGTAVPLDSPTSSQGTSVSAGEPLGRGGIGSSALGGAGWGAGFAGVVDTIQILSNPNAHPDPVGELSKTVVLGGASGGTGSAISTAVEQQFFSSAASAGESSLLGRVVGGGIGGTVAAPLFTLGQMALSDQDYTAEDYEAKGVRSAAAGAFSGVASAAGGWAAAGIAGAIAGTEVPIVGNIIGFGIGVGAYFLFDRLFGEDIENAVCE